MRVQYVSEAPAYYGYGEPEMDNTVTMEKLRALPAKKKAVLALYGAGVAGSGLLLLLVASASIAIGYAFVQEYTGSR